MKAKRLISFLFTIALLLNMCPKVAFADESYEKCIIPIISDKSEDLTWDGLKKDGTLYVTLEDACILTGGEVTKQSDESFVTERNTVKLFCDINDNEACLCVSEWDALFFSWDGKELTYPPAGLTKGILYEQPFHLNTTYFEGKVWVDLFSYANCFGADINILTENSKSYKYLGEINLTQFDGCYTMEIGIPFDEIYTEFMNNSELQFEWIDWGQEVGVFCAKGYDAVINDYQNIFTQIYYDKYDSSNVYYDVLLKVLQCRPINFGEENDLLDNLEKIQENYDKQVNRRFFVADRFLKGDDPLVEEAKFHLEGAKVIYSAATDSAKVEQKYMTLIDTVSKMNGVELSILQKSLLDAEVKDEQAYNSKNPADNVSNYSQFMKKIFPLLSGVYSTSESSATKFQKIFESYSSLYDSANKLSDEIQEPSKLTQEKYKEMAENIFTFAVDTGIGETVDKFAPQAKTILDVYDIVLKEMKSDTMASVADTAQAHFIQETVLKNVRLDKSDASYYSMLMAMQSSYFANKNMLNIGADVSKEQAALAASDDMKMTSILFQLENLITSAYECNRNFYNSPATDWKNQLIEKVTDGKSSDIPDCSISIDSYKQETNYTWYLEPTIEAEDIIVPDDSFDVIKIDNDKKGSNKYSFIKRYGKYNFISYNGIIALEKWYLEPRIAECGELGVYINSTKNENNELGVAYYQTIFSKEEGNWIPRGMAAAVYYVYPYDKKTSKIYHDIAIGFIPHWSHECSNNCDNNSAILIQEADVMDNQNYGNNVDYNGKYGCAYNDEVTISPIYDNGIMNVYNDMIALKSDDKWGYFNGRTGEQVIDFIANEFNSQYYNKSQKESRNRYRENRPYTYSDGYVAVNSNKGWALYDEKGNIVINYGTFEEVRPVHNGLAWVKKDGKWGVIQLPEFEDDTTENALSENDLKNIIASKGNICAWEYTDYDGNGTKEAFAIIGTNSMPDSYISDSIQDVYFISAEGVIEELGNTSSGLMCSIERCTEYAGKRFFSYNATAGGSGSQTYLFSVKDGNCFELDISGTIVDFYNKNYKCYATMSEFLPEGGHIWSEYELIYDECAQEFSLSNNKTNSEFQNEPTEEQPDNVTVSDYEILNAVNRYLEENQSHLGVWLSDSNPYCPSEYVHSDDTKWSCPINLDFDTYSSNEIAGFHAHWAYVDKNTLTCTLTANYETVVEFDLSEYI